MTDDFGSEYAAPAWVAQQIGPVAGDESGSDRDANAVNTAALSVWCADCHNLNIGGSYELADVELGFKAHTERTHPAPYVGAFSGPGQCYSCHRADLPPVASGDACSQCHYGTGNYAVNRFDSGAVEYVDSDFPHSGEADGYKMLGSYSVDVAGLNPTVIDETVTVGPDNLDAVCQRCHWVQETYHEGATGGDGHDIPAAYAACTDCHPGGDAAAIHAAAPAGCDSCHGVTPLTNDCGTCHPDKLVAHGYEAAEHTAAPGSGWVLIYAAGQHDSAMIGDGEVYVACSQCHGTELGPIHGNQCPHAIRLRSTRSEPGRGAVSRAGATPRITRTQGQRTIASGRRVECTECHASPSWEVPPILVRELSRRGQRRRHNTAGHDIGCPGILCRRGQHHVLDHRQRAHRCGDDVLRGRWRGNSVGFARRSCPRLVPTRSSSGRWIRRATRRSPHKTANFTVTADTTPPVTTSNAQATYTGNANITLTATDNGSSGRHGHLLPGRQRSHTDGDLGPRSASGLQPPAAHPQVLV